MPKLVDAESLFNAAVTVFAERGYGAATTREIAHRAGVSEVTLFRRYGTKAALIEAALNHCLARTPFAHLVASDDVRADLAAIVRAYALTNQSYGGAVMTLLNEMPRHPELRNAASILTANLSGAARIIQVHQDRGHIGPGDPLQKVTFLIAPLIAAGLWARSGTGMIATDLHPSDVVDAFLHGHRPP